MSEPLLDPDCRDGKHGSCVGGPCECSCHRPAKLPYICMDSSEHGPHGANERTDGCPGITWKDTVAGQVAQRQRPCEHQHHEQCTKDCWCWTRPQGEHVPL